LEEVHVLFLLDILLSCNRREYRCAIIKLTLKVILLDKWKFNLAIVPNDADRHFFREELSLHIDPVS
jgi:hypothetical protein